jgi:hypothetical protein
LQIKNILALRETIEENLRLLPCGFSGFSGRQVLLFDEHACFSFNEIIPHLCLSLFGKFSPSGSDFVFKDRERFAGKLFMLAQIKITTRCNAFKLFTCKLAFLVAFAEWKLKENVRAGAGIVRQLSRGLNVETERLPREPDTLIKSHPLLDPISMPGLPAPVRLRLAGMTRRGHSRH